MQSEAQSYPEPPKKSGSKAIVLSLILNIMLAGVAGVLYHQNVLLQDEVHEYAEELATVSENMIAYEQQLNMTLTQLDYYKEVANKYSSEASSSDGSQGIIGTARIPVVTVQTLQYGFSTSYEGEILWAEVELVQGEGRVLVNTEVINGVDVQSSLRTAADVAAELTGVSFSGTDIILTIEGGSDVEIVDGASAGSALTIAIYAAVTGQEPQSGVYITGTISADGSVGVISGVEYKGVAVGEKGGTVFLVPSGQSTLTTYQAVTRTMGRRTYTFYEPVTVNLGDYLAEQGYNVSVVEISSIEEAVEYYFPA